MRKVLGMTLGLLAAATLTASAGEITGTVKAIDRADHAVVLDDGTKLTVSDSQLGTLTPGEQVKAMYETQGGKNVVTEMGTRGIGSEFRGTTNWGAAYGTQMDSIQAE